MKSDEFYMEHAFKLAMRGRFTTTPNPNVGCVIVLNDEIVGEGYHLFAGAPHAEVHALRIAGEKARGATAYITLEPCSYHGRTKPCVDALVTAGIVRVVASMKDPNPKVSGRGFRQLRQAGIDVCCGLMVSEAEKINRGFLKCMRTGFPYVQVKLAVSLDARTAMASGESKWITSLQARQDVQRLRAESSAILSTSSTVLADNPTLTVRWNELGNDIKDLYPKKNFRQPRRIILDSKNRVTPKHRLICQTGTVWLARLQPDKKTWPKDVEQFILPSNSSGIDLVIMMKQLAKRQVNSIWVEAGAHLFSSLLEAGLVDELILYLSPKLLGNNARGLCHLSWLSKLADAPEFSFDDVQRVGPDLRLRLIIKKY